MHLEFEHSQEKLRDIAALVLDRALKLGATSANVQLNENIDKNIDVLNGSIENFETSINSNLGISIYVGNKKGSVGISQIPPHDIDGVIKQALDIANYTESDSDNALPDKEVLCTTINENLELFNPSALDNHELIAKAKNIEQVGLDFDKQITKSDGSSISLAQHNFVIANTNGFNLGYKTTYYSMSLSLIGENSDGMQTDYWYDSARDFNDLISDHELASIAGSRVLRRLNRGKIKTGIYSVIFDQPIAKALIGNLLGALSGSNLYRNLSFLNNSLGTKVLPEWVSLTENPFIVKGLSSCYFDSEGAMVKPRNLIENGVVNGYILSSYTARKLKMQTTGNAGGNHNITVTSNFSGDIYLLAKNLTYGLIIIETIGHGINMVTGDYSFGASGLWVENGAVSFFVDNITIAGNLKELFKSIQYIANDVKHGSIMCGSILADGVSVSV